MLIIIITFVMSYVSAEPVHVDLIEDCTKQVFIYALRGSQSVLHHIELGAPPFDDEDVRIDKVGRRADIDDWRQR